MARLVIDRLHARYLVDRPSVADRLDACLRRVVAEELDRELLEADPHPADHVCVAGVTVSVRLDADAETAPTARTWARQIMAALERRIGDGTDVVVYPRTLDALVDLVVSLGRGDTGRAWAWRQVGLVGDAAPEVRPSAAVAAALVTHPELAPAALMAAAVRGRVPLSAGGWVAVARAVQRLSAGLDGAITAGLGWADRDAADGGGATETARLPDRVPGDHADHAAGDDPDGIVAGYADLVLRAPVGRGLPDADLSPYDRVALARLAVLCAAPWLARSEPVVVAVARALPRRRFGGLPAAAASTDSPAPVGRGATPSGGGAETQRAAAAPTHTAPAAARPDPDPPATAGPPANGAAPSRADRDREGACSAVGGALFLIPVVTELNLVAETGSPGAPLADRPFPWVVSCLAVRLTGASADDPAILVLGGPGADADPALPGVSQVENAALVGLAERVEAWLRRHLRLRADDNLDWLWRRPATIVAEPGWIEAVVSLDDVDTRVRAAGLDLDPGFVWWLGAVMRIRYV